MNYKAGFLVFSLLAGCLAIPKPEDDLSIFFDHTDADARLVGATQAAVGAHPHMVALTTGLLVRSFMCGGSVVTERTILTAAHCINAFFSFGSLTNSLRATVGTNRWNTGGRTVSISRNVTHPHYVVSTIRNDIGLLITSSVIPFTNLIQPITLNYQHVGGGVPSTVAGWGRIRAGGALSANLLELHLDTVDPNRCVTLVEQAKIDLNRPTAPTVEPHIEICTFHSPGFGTCNGDSGSALSSRSNGQQIGIVSWGFPCALGAPDMFVRISGFADFLRANIV